MIKLDELKTGDRVWAMLIDEDAPRNDIARMIRRTPHELIFLRTLERKDDRMPQEFYAATVDDGQASSFEAMKCFMSREEAILAAVEYVEVQAAFITDGLRRYVEMLPEDHELNRPGEGDGG
jgi:hypothetical protein